MVGGGGGRRKRYLTKTPMIMLSIPVLIVGVNKHRVFITVLTRCVFFLIGALTATSIICIFCIDIDSYYIVSSARFANHLKAQSYSTTPRPWTTTASTFHLQQEEVHSTTINNASDPKHHLLFVESRSKSYNRSNNGTRRSYSSQVRLGHQDLRGEEDDKEPALVVRPWSFDPQCSLLQIRFAEKATFKPRALVSFPGSGNSWLRYLIECSTGIFTGSVFNDKNLFSRGLLGELRLPNDGSTIVQKTHHDALRFTNFKTKQAYVKLTESMFGYRGILLIRNPYDALISYWNLIKTHDHTGNAPLLDFHSFKWKIFASTMIRKWSSVIMDWVENSQSLLIVQYEKLKKNPSAELIQILDFLHQPLNQERMHCLLKHGEGPFHRKKKREEEKNKKKNSLSINNNNPFAVTMMMSTDSRKKEKNFLLSSSEQNSKSWNGDADPLPPLSHFYSLTSTATEDLSLSSSLDLIVQKNIRQINRFFKEKNIPIFLNYTGLTTQL